MFPSSFSLSRGPIYIPQKFITSTESSYAISSVQFSCSVVSNSLRPRELQHTRPPCPSPTPRVHSNSTSIKSGCHPAISSSVVPFSSCLQSLPASESFSSHQKKSLSPTTRLLCLFCAPRGLWASLYLGTCVCASVSVGDS